MNARKCNLKFMKTNYTTGIFNVKVVLWLHCWPSWGLWVAILRVKGKLQCILLNCYYESNMPWFLYGFSNQNYNMNSCNISLSGFCWPYGLERYFKALCLFTIFGTGLHLHWLCLELVSEFLDIIVLIPSHGNCTMSVCSKLTLLAVRISRLMQWVTDRCHCCETDM